MQKMETIITKSINSKAVQGMASVDRMKEVDIWSLFFDSGLDYLAQLQLRIKYYDVFKAQFGELLDAVSLKKTSDETFRCIMASPYFWTWWSSQLWRVCFNYGENGHEEIYFRLMFNTSLIPQNILFKIFQDEQKTNDTKQIRVQAGIKHRVAQVC